MCVLAEPFDAFDRCGAGRQPFHAPLCSRVGNSGGDNRVAEGMNLELSDDAAALLSKRGKILVIDLIRPTG